MKLKELIDICIRYENSHSGTKYCIYDLLKDDNDFYTAVRENRGALSDVVEFLDSIADECVEAFKLAEKLRKYV